MDKQSMVGDLYRPLGPARGCKGSSWPTGVRIQLFGAILTVALAGQLARAIMSLPDGIENILGFVPKSTFQCERDGYFGDIDNDCRIFHLCQKQVNANGRTEWRHWTYACGNQTMFNQLTLTCAFVDEAIPCRHASQFQYLNEVIHKPAEPFLTDADVTSGISYYSNRIMSDGARARAFEDSRLMAQIGGSHQPNEPVETALKVASPPQQQQVQLQTMPQSQPQRIATAPEDGFKPESEEREADGNSIDAQPLIETFQSLVNHGSQQPREVNLRQNPTASYPGLQADLFAQQNNRQQAQQQAPRQAEVSWPQATTSQLQLNQVIQAQSQAQTVPSLSPSSSFDFAIATDHHQSSSQSPSSLVFMNQFSGLNLHQAPRQSLVQSTSPLSQHAPLPPQPQPQAQVHQQQQQYNNQQAQANQQQQAQRLLTTEKVSQANTPESKQKVTTENLSLVPLTTTELNQLIATTTQHSQRANLAATTTPVAPAQATTTLASPTTTTLAPTTSTPGRRASSAGQPRLRGQVQAGERFSGAPGFQSTRLSSGRAGQSEPGVIMRRQVPSNQLQQHHHHHHHHHQQQQQASLPRQQVSSQTPFAPVESGSGFWRRAFHAQLMAPRFESLLTRRRV